MCCCCNLTSPLRTGADIEAIVSLRQHAGAESAVSPTPSAKHPSWMFTLGQEKHLEPFLPMDATYCRQQLPTAYVLNGALYLASRDFLLREQAFLATETLGYVMPVERSVDIDTPLDWQWAELMMERQV